MRRVGVRAVIRKSLTLSEWLLLAERGRSSDSHVDRDGKLQENFSRIRVRRIILNGAPNLIVQLNGLSGAALGGHPLTVTSGPEQAPVSAASG